jgi:hypothetical protein
MKTKLKVTRKKNDLKESHNMNQIMKKTNYHWPFDLNIITNKHLQTLGIILLTIFISNPIQAQVSTTQTNEVIEVAGIVKDDKGPIDKVSVKLKGTNFGATTDENGAFTFPKTLKEGDVLVFSHLGYNTHELRIDKNDTFLEVTLTTEVIEMLGALEVDKPYKSKRKK